MDEQEVARYQMEFRAEFYRVAYILMAGGPLSEGTPAAMFELYQEQLKAAYTNGYEDHAALGAGVVH
jgi:hypothetical protein